MWSRQGLAAAALAALLSLPAAAQIEDSGLGQVDPWGIGYLGEGETTFQTRMWRGARSEDLLAMLQDLRTGSLTPSERILVRRMALSPALAPVGDDANHLLYERARIAFELGEAEAASAMMLRLPKITPPEPEPEPEPEPVADTPDGETPEADTEEVPEAPEPEITEPAEPEEPKIIWLPDYEPEERAADLQLALGNEATACSYVPGSDADGAFWAKLRAVCAALSGNTAGAELAIEMAQSQGVDDSWLLNAVFATSGELPNPPKAKFDSGLAFAISTRANLETPAKAIGPGRPDIAASIARRKLSPPALRVQAANIAAEAGLITGEEHRTAYNAALAADGYAQATRLDKAYFAAADAFRSAEERTDALAAALKDASGNPARYAAVSRLLAEALSRLPVDAETAPHALDFARAAIAAGEPREASRWTSAIRLDDTPLADFETAWTDGLVILAGSNTSTRSVNEVARRLMETAKTPAEKRAAARLMSLWSAFYSTAPSDGRAYIVEHSAKPGKAQAPERAIAILAATRSGTASEAVMATLDMTGGDPSKLETPDLIILIEALRRIGAEDAARVLALEATGYWKPRK
ncbi:MAG: hypothetical protein KDA53_08245 [Hyphomonas sp.]|nr:hypothetical protein [Hyphomonas sp.]